KITFAIEQADADKAEAQITGRFCMITGQNAQTARCDGQTFVETEFGAEIGDRMSVQGRRILMTPSVLVAKVRLKILQHLAHALGKLMVLETNPQFVVRDLMQNRHGIVIQVLPATG